MNYNGKHIFFWLIFFLPAFCMAQTQIEMNQEAAGNYKKADAAMAAVYKKVMSAQDEAGKKLLLEAQRAWIKYKEAHCTSVSHEYEGGSAQPQSYYICLEETTQERIRQLKNYLDGKN